MPNVFKFNGEDCEVTTYEAAEALAGFSLDRRLNYYITQEGEVEEQGACTMRCSGCSCGCEGGCSCGDIGIGCHECGYTGKRRIWFGFPARSPDERKRDRERDRSRRKLIQQQTTSTTR